MVNSKCTDHRAAMNPLCRNEKLCFETNLSVDCRILRIVEFGLKLLDFSKSLLYEHELQKPFQIAKYQYCRLVEDSQVDSIFIEQPVLSFSYFFLTKIVTAQA